MLKIAAIIGGVLLMAGVALAGTLTSLDKSNSPMIGQTTLPRATTTAQQEQRGRQNEPEHNATASRGDDHSPQSSSGPGPSSGPNDRSGHDRGADDNSGHGGGTGNDD